MADPTKELTPESLANQLFDSAILQFKGDPREAARRIINFLTEALVFTIVETAGDEAARKALLKSVGEKIAATSPVKAKK